MGIVQAKMTAHAWSQQHGEASRVCRFRARCLLSSTARSMLQARGSSAWGRRHLRLTACSQQPRSSTQQHQPACSSHLRLHHKRHALQRRQRRQRRQHFVGGRRRRDGVPHQPAAAAGGGGGGGGRRGGGAHCAAACPPAVCLRMACHISPLPQQRREGERGGTRPLDEEACMPAQPRCVCAAAARHFTAPDKQVFEAPRRAQHAGVAEEHRAVAGEGAQAGEDGPRRRRQPRDAGVAFCRRGAGVGRGRGKGGQASQLHDFVRCTTHSPPWASNVTDQLIN